MLQGQRNRLPIIYPDRLIADKVELVPPPEGAGPQGERHLEDILVLLQLAGGVCGSGVLLCEVGDVDGVVGEYPLADVEALRCGIGELGLRRMKWVCTFMRRVGLSIGMTVCGCSSLVRRDRTCPLGKNRL